MQIREIGWKKYRAFKEASLQIRPLTLLYGYNGAGKSSALRWLPLLAESVQHRDQPIHLDGIAGEAYFRSLIWKEKSKEFSFWIVGEQEGRRIRVDYTVSQAITSAPPFVERLKVDVGGDAVDLVWDLESDRTDLVYELKGTDQKIPITFAGPLPVFGPVGPELAAADAALRQVLLSQRVLWVPGTRERPGRSQRRPASAPQPSRIGTKEAMALLAWEQQRFPLGSELLRLVQDGYRHLGWEFALSSPSQDEVGARIGRQGGQQVDLVDSGEGLGQLLPVLVGAAMARLSAEPVILCVEQPELHLHTHGARQLAEWLIRLAAESPAATLILETHAEAVMLSVQLALVRGQIRPEQTALCLVRQEPTGESRLIPIGFDPKGYLMRDDMRGTFDDVAEMARELYRERRERG